MQNPVDESQQSSIRQVVVASFFSELFRTRLRYSGASLGYQFASVTAGGLSPMIATMLLSWSNGKPWPIALYMLGMALITLASVYLAAETVPQKIETG